MGGYRQPHEPDPEPADLELVCATTMHRRADRIRRFVLVPMLLGGLVLGVAGYLALRELFFATIHAHQPYLTGFLSITPAFVGSLRAARWTSDTIIRARIDGWMKEVSTAHGISAAVLEDHARLIRGQG